MGNTACCSSAHPDGVGGKSMIYIPFFIRSRILDSIAIAEKLCGTPPDSSSVHCASRIHYKLPFSFGMFNCIIQNLYREDLFYADKQFTVWSLTLDGPKKESMEMEKFSDRFRKLYPGYILDGVMRIRAKPETPVLNINDLLFVLRSKDKKIWTDNAWMF